MPISRLLFSVLPLFRGPFAKPSSLRDPPVPISRLAFTVLTWSMALLQSPLLLGPRVPISRLVFAVLPLCGGLSAKPSPVPALPNLCPFHSQPNAQSDMCDRCTRGLQVHVRVLRTSGAFRLQDSSGNGSGSHRHHGQHESRRRRQVCSYCPFAPFSSSFPGPFSPLLLFLSLSHAPGRGWL